MTAPSPDGAPVITPDATPSPRSSPMERATAPLVSTSLHAQAGPLMIGIAGGTASGKTETAMEIASQLNLHEDLEVIHQSSFYKDARAYPEVNDENYNFDHPDAFDYDLMIRTLVDLKKGKSVYIPHYDMRTRLRNDKLFIHCDDDTRLSRRLVRDVKGMGESVESVISKYLSTIKLSHERYLKPCMKYADLIIPDGVENVIALQAIVQDAGRCGNKWGRKEEDSRGGRLERELLGVTGPHDDEPQLMIHELKSSDEVAYITRVLRKPRELRRESLLFYCDRLSYLIVRYIDGIMFAGEPPAPDHSESVVYASLIGYGDVMESGVKQHDRLCSFGKLTVPRSQLTARRHFLASGTLAPQTTSLGAASPMSASGSDCNVTIGITPKFADPPAPLQLPGAAMSSASPMCSPVGRSITIDGCSSVASSAPLVEVVYLPARAQSSIVVVLMAVLADQELAIATVKALQAQGVSPSRIIIACMFADAEMCKSTLRATGGAVQVVVGSLDVTNNVVELRGLERDLCTRYLVGVAAVLGDCVKANSKMMAANRPKVTRNVTVCTMMPLRRCIENHMGDISQCVKEVRDFERTCNKRKHYVHDRDGLDDCRSGLYGSKQTFIEVCTMANLGDVKNRIPSDGPTVSPRIDFAEIRANATLFWTQLQVECGRIDPRGKLFKEYRASHRDMFRRLNLEELEELVLEATKLIAQYFIAFTTSLIASYLYLYFTGPALGPELVPWPRSFITGLDMWKSSTAAATPLCSNTSEFILSDDEVNKFEGAYGRPYVIDLGFAHGLGHKLELQMLAMVAGLRGQGMFSGALWTTTNGSGDHSDMMSAAPLLGQLWGGNISDEASLRLKGAVRISPIDGGSCPRRNPGQQIQSEDSSIRGITLDEMADYLKEGPLAIVCPWFDKRAGEFPSTAETLLVRHWLRSRIVKVGRGLTFFESAKRELLVAIHIRRGDLLVRQQHRMTRNRFFANTAAHVLSELASNSSAQVVVVSETWKEGGHECSLQRKLCNHLGQSVDFEDSLRKQIAALGKEYGNWRVKVKLDANTARSFITLVAADIAVLSSSGYSAWAGLLSTGITIYPYNAKSQSVMRRMQTDAISSIPVNSSEAWDGDALVREWSWYRKCPARLQIREAII
ncbi:hypothetical protein FOL47_000158 [Perkinsus chesapeaki]|uniref:uridine/cytidine kinase n=1 Tax=Perkinsus chesapeaki TaxID=330153 RepID=A0A7J6MML4_PERCH|nr:hypothetical protein FOL47_000158 [Perkinsus chesapeaki]